MLAGRPAAVAVAPGHLQVLVRGVNEVLYLKEFVTGRGWSSFIPALGNVGSDPGAARTATGRVDAVAGTVDTKLTYRSLRPGTDPSGVRSDTTVEGVPAGVSSRSGRLDAFYNGAVSNLVYRWYDGTNWSPADRVLDNDFGG